MPTPLHVVNVPRRRHPKKYVEEALDAAEAAGWSVIPGAAGDRWGVMRCPAGSRQGVWCPSGRHRGTPGTTPGSCCGQWHDAPTPRKDRARMSDYRFTLMVDGPDLQETAHAEALFRMGCSDAAIGRRGEVQYLDFDRSAASFPEAVFDAMAAIEAAVPGARVVRLEPDDLVTMAEIAARTSRTRESVRLLIAGERGPGGFPPPATHALGRLRLWRWLAVAAWFAGMLGRPVPGDDEADVRFAAALNAGLDLRHHQAGLPAAERRRILELVS